MQARDIHIQLRFRPDRTSSGKDSLHWSSARSLGLRVSSLFATVSPFAAASLLAAAAAAGAILTAGGCGGGAAAAVVVVAVCPDAFLSSFCCCFASVCVAGLTSGFSEVATGISSAPGTTCDVKRVTSEVTLTWHSGFAVDLQAWGRLCLA